MGVSMSVSDPIPVSTACPVSAGEGMKGARGVQAPRINSGQMLSWRRGRSVGMGCGLDVWSAWFWDGAEASYREPVILEMRQGVQL